MGAAVREAAVREAFETSPAMAETKPREEIDDIDVQVRDSRGGVNNYSISQDTEVAEFIFNLRESLGPDAPPASFLRLRIGGEVLEPNASMFDNNVGDGA